MPSLRAIVLDSPDASSARANFRIALWFDVPPGRQKFYAAKNPLGSAWIDATTAQVNAIASGNVVEEVVNYQPDGQKPLATMQTDVAAMWAAGQARINAANTWPHYGSTWDGTTWTIAAVA